MLEVELTRRGEKLYNAVRILLANKPTGNIPREYKGTL